MSASKRKHGVTRMLALGLVLMLATPGTGFFAQNALDRDLSEPIESLGDWQERPEYALSLRETLGLAMDRNLDIAVQNFEREISGNGITTAKSAFDSTLTTTGTISNTTNQNANPFSGTTGFDNTFEFETLNSNWNDPTIWGGNFNVQFQTQRGSFSPGLSILDPQYSSFLNLTYRQSILRNFGLEINRAPIKISQNNTLVSESQFKDTVMATMEATESNYWELVFARRDLEVKKRSLDLAQELLRINKAKVEVGTLAPIDVTQAEAGVASRAQDLIVSIGSLLSQEDSLRQLLNPPRTHAIWTSTLVPSDQPNFNSEEVNTKDAIEIARQNRPELEQQKLTIQSNALQEKIDRKAKRWDLFVEGRYNTEGLEGQAQDCSTIPCTPLPAVLDTDLSDSIGELTDRDFADWVLQAGLTIPIGNRALKAQYANSRLRHEQSKIELDNRMLAAEIDVTQKVRDIKVNRQRVRAARKNKELQEKNVDAERKKYENGMSTSFQVLEIQEDLATAESQENRARVDFQKSLTALERAKGTLLDARNIQVATVEMPGGRSAGGRR